MAMTYKISEFCGDWDLQIKEPGDLPKYLYFKSRNNAELVKSILEWEDAHPNETIPYQPTPPNEPMTLEQLRQMDGRPVWFDTIKRWGIVKVNREVCERQGDDGCKTCPIAKAFDRLAAIEDILGDEYDLDELREMVQAKRDGRCVVLPEGGCEDKDGENALKSAMHTCFYHNNPVTRFIADAVAEKLTRQEAQAALRREQDG